jgi:hypothetical protein
MPVRVTDSKLNESGKQEFRKKPFPSAAQAID